MARAVVAAAWAYEGLWAKVLDREPSQRRILAGLPGAGERDVRRVTLALGILETCAGRAGGAAHARRAGVAR